MFELLGFPKLSKRVKAKKKINYLTQPNYIYLIEHLQLGSININMQSHSTLVPGGGMAIASDQSMDNIKQAPNELDQQLKMPPTSAPSATFERTSFD